MAKLNDKNSAKSSSPYAEDWLPIRQILNGMIQLDTGEFVSGVKVVPKNIFLMDEGMQNNTIYTLQNFYNSIDYDFWLIIADRPVDINLYLSKLQMLYNNTPNAEIRKLILQDIDKANMFMSVEYNVVDTEYFLLFKEKRLELVQKKLHNIMSGLATCGLQSVQTSNEDLRMLLDNFLNDGEQTTFGSVGA